VTGRELDQAVREELRLLPKGLADEVARHLVVAGELLDTDPEAAYPYARTAARLASRVAAAREAAGLAAYLTGRYTEALAELRAARRMTGASTHLHLMADAERGLGRPERALAIAGSDEAAGLDAAGRLELRIVAAGARRDLGQLDAALATLRTSELTSTARRLDVARLRYAYADLLLVAERPDEAREWFARAVDADPEGETGAAERLAELDGVVFIEEESDPGQGDGPQAPVGEGEEVDAATAEAGAALVDHDAIAGQDTSGQDTSGQDTSGQDVSGENVQDEGAPGPQPPGPTSGDAGSREL
jgi:tetratricopeptide (TPR) repeat protein